MLEHFNSQNQLNKSILDQQKQKHFRPTKTKAF